MASVWGLDPVFSAKVKLMINDVHSLDIKPELPGVYFLHGHPISEVHLIADVMAVRCRTKGVEYEVDDGHGVITCIHWRPEDGGWYTPTSGDLVSVIGRVAEYRGERQIKVSYILPEVDPNTEPLHWLEVDALKSRVYKVLPKPFQCSNPTDEHASLNKSIHKIVSETVVEFVRDFCGPISRSELEANSELRANCVLQVGQTKDMSGLMSRVVDSLCTNGSLIPVTRQDDTPLYEVLADEKHLHPLILEFMKIRERREGTKMLGVHEDWIVEHVKRHMSSVPATRIVTAIHGLIDNSFIFEVSAKSYKIVT